MSHTYYKDRLGFEPEYESRLQQSSSQQTSVTKSTLYSSGLSASSKSTSQTKATVHHQSSAHHSTSTSNNHYSSRDQQHAITSSSTGNGVHTGQDSSSHGVYEENLTKFKGPTEFIILISVI